MRARDISNQRFGRLVALRRVGTEKYNGGSRAVWECVCDCGNVINARGSALTTGNTKSCGCLQKERASESHLIKHGGSYTRLYRIWHDMKSRCANPNAINYKYYGGAGVSVCEEWSSSFERFSEWANANGYSSELTLDRIDPYGNYEPGNCRWTTWSVQNKNKRANQ